MLHQSANTQGASIDLEEIIKFQKMSSEWWDRNGPVSTLHDMNKIRVPFIVDGMRDFEYLDPKFANTSKPLSNLKVMEVGCGGGICTEALGQLGAIVTAIDPGTELLQIAKEHAKQNKNITNEITFINAPIEDIYGQYRNQFDLLIFYDVAEHIENLDLVMKASVEVLKPGGSFFIATFNKTPIAWIYSIIFLEYISKKIPLGTHEIHKYIPPQDIIDILKENNCEMKTIKGSTYFNDKWIWTKADLCHYFIHAVKNK